MFDTATHLWRTADKSTRAQAAEAFWNSEERPEHAQAAAFIAKKLNLRPATARRLSPERKASYLAQFDNISEPLCAQLWTAFYLAHRREMLSMFLDALSIKHEHGLFEGEDIAPPSVAALTAAIRQVVEAFGVSEVRRYLSILAVKDPVFWTGLKEAVKEARLGQQASKASSYRRDRRERRGIHFPRMNADGRGSVCPPFAAEERRGKGWGTLRICQGSESALGRKRVGHPPVISTLGSECG